MIRIRCSSLAVLPACDVPSSAALACCASSTAVTPSERAYVSMAPIAIYAFLGRAAEEGGIKAPWTALPQGESGMRGLVEVEVVLAAWKDCQGSLAGSLAPLADDLLPS